MVRVLFVCKGNICRSPVAQGVFEELVRREGLEGKIEVDSARTHSYHLGKAPDERAQKSAARRGIDICSQKARRFAPEDCRKFDYILVMDKKNRRRVARLCKGSATEVRLFLEHASGLPEREVPDPVSGGPEDFDLVMDLVEAASKGLLEYIKRHLPAPVRTISMRTEDADLLDRVPPALRDANGVPELEQASARQRAALLASDALAGCLLPGGVRISPLGPGWSRDIDLHLQTWPEPTRLEALGWIPLDALLHRLGIPSRGRWTVLDDGQVLAGLDLHLDPPPDPVTSLVNRCRRRGEVRVREVLEARALLGAGHTLPANDPVIRMAARVEAGLGGRDLARWRNGPALGAPASLPGLRLRRRLTNMLSALRPRLVVAVSGVDGSGKTTLSRVVTRNLNQAGVPASRVWARPGLSTGWLDILARAGKKLLGLDLSPGVERVAGGMPASGLRSRHGIIGWTWAMLVTLSFLVDVRLQHMRGRGVLLYDRHLPDALVTLDFVYEGVDLRLQRAMVRRGLPKPKLSIYLDVSAEVALTRKPEDIFGEYAIRRQLEGYKACLGEVENLRRLDGTRPADELATIVTRWLVES